MNATCTSCHTPAAGELRAFVDAEETQELCEACAELTEDDGTTWCWCDGCQRTVDYAYMDPAWSTGMGPTTYHGGVWLCLECRALEDVRRFARMEDGSVSAMLLTALEAGTLSWTSSDVDGPATWEAWERAVQPADALNQAQVDTLMALVTDWHDTVDALIAVAATV